MKFNVELVVVLLLAVVACSCVLVVSASDPENDVAEKPASTEAEGGQQQPQEQVDPAKVEYAKGSVCGYCQYCQFCKLCDQDCPCETSPTKPNCHMCKYCKFCYLCSAVCDTICQPGGILDKVSSSIVNALPSFNKAEVDGDIDGVQQWIDKEREEL